MEQTQPKLNIYQRMECITAELDTVAKNLNVSGVGQTYKAVSEADVLRAVKPLEMKYGVYSYAIARTLIDMPPRTTKSGSVQYVCRVEETYRFVNVDDSSQYIEIKSWGDGIDSQDKGVGKAMTYADKYALMKAYKIVTGDDPDQFPSEEVQAQKTQRTNAKKAQPVQENVVDAYSEYEQQTQPVQLATPAQIKWVRDIDYAKTLEDHKAGKEGDCHAMEDYVLKKAGYSRLEDIPAANFDSLIKQIQAAQAKKRGAK